jgi:hypothetical protein
MAELLKKGGKFGVGAGSVDILEYPAEEPLLFGAGGAQAGEILHVASLVAVESRT